MYYRQIGKKWYFTVSVEMTNGTTKRIERVGGNTQREARIAAKRFLAGADKDGRLFSPRNITVKEYAEGWLIDYVEVNLADNTIDAYKTTIKQFIEKFGNLKLVDITPLKLQSFINDLRHKYKASTIQQKINILKKLFGDAVEPYEYIQKNPAHRLKTPARNAAMPKAATIFTDAELTAIINRFKDDQVVFIPIMLAYHMGMRKGECLALKWSDVDFAHNTITISKNQYDKNGSIIVYNKTKSKKSRIIDMDSTIASILKEHKLYQQHCQKKLGKAYPVSDYICCKPDRRKTKSDDLRYFNMWCKNNGMTGSFHSLRHTHATKLIDGGMDLDYVSRRLGHSNIVITSKTYVHLTNKRRNKAVKIMDDIL